MIVLWILLALVLLIAVIMALSVTVYVKIGEEVQIKAGIAGIRLPIVPAPEKKPETEKQKAKREKKEAEKAKKKAEEKAKKDAEKKAKKEAKKTAKKTGVKPPDKKPDEKTLFETVEFALDLLKSTVPGAVGLLGKIRFTDVKLFLSVGAEDAEKTALLFAHMNTAVYNLLALIDKAMTLKPKDISIVPDFVTGELRYDVSFKVKLRIGGAVSSAIGILFRLIGTLVKSAGAKPAAKPPHPAPKASAKPKNERKKTV